MPSQYTDHQKNVALEMLRNGSDIAFIHSRTDIPERTLRLWRKQLNEQSDCQIAKKSFSPASDQPPQPDNDPAEPSESDLENFTYIRDKLMRYARQMAGDLQPNAPDANRRTLALTRVLDRIEWLDSRLPALEKKEERPVWRDAYDAFMACNPSTTMRLDAASAAENREPHEQAKVYERYLERIKQRRI